jgi:sodium/potassium-transporting ATPase subunit alpha
LLAYRTLSIQVTDTVSHGVEPTKGHVKDIADLEWHKISAHEVLRRLRSDEAQGLDNNQAQRRLQENGKNVLSPPPTHRFRRM